MADYYISKAEHGDRVTWASIDSLLLSEGIRRDPHLDYTCVLLNTAGEVIGTGSCFGNTLRCLAISKKYQGEGLANRIIAHLIEIQFNRGITHIFLYTKCNSAEFLGSLGFHEIIRIDDQIVFMENRRTGFSNYLKKLEQITGNVSSHSNIAAIVMNSNPFTLGHQYLIEQAAAENELVHLFLLSEDVSVVPFAVRKELVRKGIAHLPNVILHDSGPYIISNATFPSYFQKDEENVIISHANLDLEVFKKIAKRLGITRRYVGEEPYSIVTGLYNQIMVENLPKSGIECRIIPRLKTQDGIVSASIVRQCIQRGDFLKLKNMVPACTFHYFTSEEAEPVIKSIQQQKQVVHY